MQRFITHFFLSALLAFVCFAVGGLVVPLRYEQTASDDAVTFALDYAFPTAAASPGPWTETAGAITHRKLYRRAFMKGKKTAPYSEQVLKVGFPFTVVRGFIRTSPAGTDALGAVFVAGDMEAGQATFMPLLPVWPGLVFFGLVGAIALSGGSALLRARRTRKA